MAARGPALPPHRIVWIGSAVLLCAYTLLWALVPIDDSLLARLLFLPGVGVIGAIILNTSGTGGSVVFVPVFNALRLGAKRLKTLDGGWIVPSALYLLWLNWR